MPSFGSIKAIESYIKKSVDSSIEKVGEYIVEDTKEEIDKKVYARGTPKEYERSYELKNSVVYNKESTNSDIKLEIYNDESKMNHYSIIDGSKLGFNIVEIVTQGKAGLIFGEGFWTDERDYINEEINKLKKDKMYKKILKEELYKRGITVTEK